MNTTALAERLWQARLQRKPIAPLTDEFPELTLEQAYAIQDQLRVLEEKAGERLVGFKMGLTSQAKQRDVGVFAPIRGYLLGGHEFESGAVLEGGIHPRVEPEIAVVLHRWPKRVAEVEECVSGIYPAFEILDSRFQGFKFRLPDVVADNTSASGFVLGRQNLLSVADEVRLLGVVVRKNGVVEQTGAPAAVLGDPLRAVTALARSLSTPPEIPETGLVVLTGGITAAVPLGAGETIEVSWPGEVLTLTRGGERGAR